MGVPVTEYDRVNFGLAVEHLNVKLHGDVNYQPYPLIIVIIILNRSGAFTE